MGTAHGIQNALISGELSPRALGRTDLARFKNGAAQILNYALMPTGGAEKVPGTKWVASTKDSTQVARLVRFRFSTTQEYVLEFGDEYFRIYRDEGQVTSGASPVEVVTPYTEDELYSLQFAQSADTLYVVHPDHAPRAITRTSHTAWSINTFGYQYGPWQVRDFNAVTFQPSHTSGSGRTITASSATFASTDVGRLIRIEYTSSPYFGVAIVTGYTDSTHVTVDILVDFNNTTANVKWRMGAWSDTTGWPAAVAFHEQRLCFANTVTEPQNIWMSVSQVFTDFSPTEDDLSVVDDNALTFVIASNDVNAIQWMVSFEKLLLGTLSGIWQIGGSTDSAAFGATNVSAKRKISTGSLATVSPVEVGTNVIFAGRSGRQLYDVKRAELALDTLEARDISILADHLLKEGGAIKQICYQENPYNTVWVLCTSGQLFGIVYNTGQDEAGWFRYTPGGNLTGASYPTIDSICVIAKSDGTEDQLWMSVKRTINSATVRSVEFMEDYFVPSSTTDRTSMYFVDAGATYDGSATTSISGLDHLEGETVDVVADGYYIGTKTVASGAISLSTAASIVHVGYHKNSQIQTLPREYGNPKGTAQGKMQKIDHLGIRLLNSMMLQYGQTLTGTFYAFSGFTDSTTGPLVTDDLRMPAGFSYDRRGQYVIRQNKPYASTVLCLMPESSVTQS